MSYKIRNDRGCYQIFKDGEQVTALAWGSEEKTREWMEEHLTPDIDGCIKAIDLQVQIDKVIAEDWKVGQYSNHGYLNLIK